MSQLERGSHARNCAKTAESLLLRSRTEPALSLSVRTLIAAETCSGYRPGYRTTRVPHLFHLELEWTSLRDFLHLLYLLNY